jgi:DNA-binding transcriptional ArsR family regulator
MSASNIVNEKYLISLPITMTIAKGLSDPHRIRILDLLYHKELSVNELSLYLKKYQLEIAATTLRHHVNVLRKNNLIRITKTKEVKGTVMKYYKSNLKVLFANDPHLDFKVIYDPKLINSLYPQFYKLIKKFIIENKNLLNLTKLKTRCKICKINHYDEYLIFLVFNVLFTKALSKMLRAKIH